MVIDRAFTFHICIPCGKTFSVVPPVKVRVFYPSVSYPFGELCAVFIKLEIVVCMEKSKICRLGKG